jgi:CPA2 family monovalent cation:H+ antiporter-2
MLIAQGSEFGLILLSVPQMRALLGGELSSVLVSAIALTLALTPATAQAGRVLAGRMRRRRSPRIDRELTPTTVTAPVLIIGMGRVGRAVADAVRAFDIDYFAIEKDTRRLHAAIADGYTVEYGDSTDTRYWAPMELSQRTLSVLTSPDLGYLKASVSLISANFPNLRRLAIVADDQAARALRELGVQVVMDDSPARGLEVACAVLRHLGRNDSDIATWRQRFQTPTDSATLTAAAPRRAESRAPPLPAP